MGPAKRLIAFDVPVKLISFANKSMHWGTKRRISKKMKLAAYHYCLCSTKKTDRRLPAKITMTRIYSGRAQEMDDDNLVRALKAVRDGIAAAFGFDDGDKGWSWNCRQKKSDKETCVLVEIES